MLISDWSSDVCSSYLPDRGRPTSHPVNGAQGEPAGNAGALLCAFGFSRDLRAKDAVRAWGSCGGSAKRPPAKTGWPETVSQETPIYGHFGKSQSDKRRVGTMDVSMGRTRWSRY